MSRLTSRELEILDMAAAGLLRKEVAIKLGISPYTVRTHFTNIFIKLSASNKANAVAIAMSRGLLIFKEER